MVVAEGKNATVSPKPKSNIPIVVALVLTLLAFFIWWKMSHISF
jgi:hypothetical protein